MKKVFAAVEEPHGPRSSLFIESLQVKNNIYPSSVDFWRHFCAYYGCGPWSGMSIGDPPLEPPPPPPPAIILPGSGQARRVGLLVSTALDCLSWELSAQTHPRFM